MIGDQVCTRCGVYISRSRDSSGFHVCVGGTRYMPPFDNLVEQPEFDDLKEQPLSSDYKLKVRDESYRHKTTLSSLAVGEVFEREGRLHVKVRLGSTLQKTHNQIDQCAVVRFGTFEEDWEPTAMFLNGSRMVQRRKATLEVE